MSRNFYEDLNLKRDCSEANIAKAYSILSIKWHPKFAGDEPLAFNANFCKVSEAYEVLSDPVKRQFFDKYGEEKLKEGFFSSGNLKGGYTFQGNPEEIFENFFGTSNPFNQIYDSNQEEQIGSVFSNAFGGQKYIDNSSVKPLIVEIPCNLIELYNGCQKTINYKQIILNGDGRTTRTIDQTKTVDILPGYSSENTIVLKKEGNQQAGIDTSDLIFKIIETPHEKYQKEGNDLIYTFDITLFEALTGSPMQIQTLDCRILNIPNDEIIRPTTVKTIQNEGFPIFDMKKYVEEQGNKQISKGDLIIKFRIQFPDEINDENNKLQQILSQ